MRRWLHLDRVRMLASRALAGGAPVKAFNPLTGIVHSVGPWRISGKCDKPVTVYCAGRGEPDGVGFVYGSQRCEVEMEVHCRKCSQCLRQRAAHWRIRALEQFRKSSRVWFGTLTFQPDRLVRHRYRIGVEEAAEGQCSDGRISLPLVLSEPDRWRKYEQSVYADVQMFFKRLRERVGPHVSLTYMVVTEKHKSGEPHYHVLIHELDASQGIRHRHLKGAWRDGFSRWKLIDGPKAISYTAKYLHKSPEARVRASGRYGVAGLPARSAELIDPTSPIQPGRGTRIAGEGSQTPQGGQRSVLCLKPRIEGPPYFEPTYQDEGQSGASLTMLTGLNSGEIEDDQCSCSLECRSGAMDAERCQPHSRIFSG